MSFITFLLKTAYPSHHNDGSEYKTMDTEPPPYSPTAKTAPTGNPFFEDDDRKKTIADKNTVKAIGLATAMGKKNPLLDKEANVMPTPTTLMDTAKGVASQLHWTYNIGGSPETDWAKAIEDAVRQAKYLRARKNVL